MGYLGKISAIVSANTSDFSAKLMASGKEVQSWARALNSAVNSASSKASSSLRGIYTEAQKTERALQAIQAKKIDFKGFEGQNLAAAVSRMQALVSATKGVNEPLNQAARSLEKLPVAMQGGFIEAMKRAQTQAERLAFEIDKIGDGTLVSGSALEKKFEAIAARAMRTADAVERLKAAAAGVEGLATGREIQFRNPELAAEMDRARRTQARAAATPGGDFAGIVERQRVAAEATAAAFAKMEEAQLSLGGDVAGTTAEYQRQLGVLRSIGSELDKAVDAAASQTRAFAILSSSSPQRSAGLFGSQSGTEEERALARARALSAEYARLPQAAQAGLQGLAGIAARVSDAVANGAANATQLNQILDRLSVGVAAGGVQAGRQDIARQIGNSLLNILTPAEAAADTVEAHAQALSRQVANTFLGILTPAQAAADTAEAHSQSLRRQIANTFLGVLDPAEAAADTVEAHSQSLRIRIANTVLGILDPAEAAADTAEAHSQSLRRQIANTFLGVLDPAEAAADTLEAHARSLRIQIANAVLGILDPAQAAADTAEAHSQSLRRQIANTFLGILDPAEAAADTVEAHSQSLRIRIANTVLGILDPAEAAADTAEAHSQSLRRQIANTFLGVLDPAEAAADTVEAHSQSLRRQIANTFLGIMTPAEAAADTAEAHSQSLRRQIANTFLGILDPAEAAADTVEAHSQSLRRRIGNSLLNILTPEEAAFDTAGGRAAARRADAGRSFADSLGGAGQQGLNLGIDQRSLRGVGAQIEYLQGRLVGLSAVARGPVVAAMERVRQVAATGFRDGTIGTAAFNRQLQNATSNLTRVAAAALNVRPGRLAEQLRRVGDVARGSFGNMGLAIQQGIFAFDDFFSVTGSLDQRIRAAGNNISQLGFIVGGTYGLIAGVAVSAVAQLTVGMLRWLGVTEDATNATKAMNSAIDSQRDKAKELADAYREVADSIAKAGLSKSGQSLLGQQQAAAGRQRQGEEAAIEAAASRSPRLAAARGLRDLEARNRQEATTIEGVLRAAARERTADEAVRRREAGILARARLAVDQNPSIDQARAAQIRNRERLAQAEGVDANEFTGDGRRRRRIARMRERDAELEARVQIARQRAAEGLVGAGQGVEARLGPLSQRLDEVGFTQAGRRIDDIFRSISDAMRDFQSGAMSQESLERFIAGLARASSEAEAAARPVLAFAESLKRLASGMARDAEESAGSLEKQLRNDANRLTGEGGANDPRTVAARDSAARASQVRSIAAIERLAIERDEARMRSQFEANLASGRGPAAAVDIARRMAVQESILRNEESSPALKERARLAVEEYSLQLNEFVAALPEAAALKARSDALAASVAEFAKSVSDGAKAAEEEVAIRKALADRANPQGDVLRGLDLIERPVDAAFREIRQRVADFRAAADRVGLANNDRRDGLERILNDERRQVAPAWFSMMEEVQNAVLSGPSRAALNASDASSVEGQRELNRLLRGEDSARDTNLVELEKQTEELRKLNDMIRAHGVAVANN